MNRRDFMKAATGAVVAGSLLSGEGHASPEGMPSEESLQTIFEILQDGREFR